MTNLLILSVAILTNTIAGDGTFKHVGQKLVGLRDASVAFEEYSIGYLHGTNPVEVIKARRVLWAKTNYMELPVGVVMPPNPIPLQSNPKTIDAEK